MVVSGILAQDEESLTALALAERLRVVTRRTEDGWLCLTLAAKEP